jgi:glutamate--cysteine ligase
VKESNLSELLNRRLALLGERANLSLLEQCLHGIERECLRVTVKVAWRKRRTPKPWVPR